jgi:hypothetical protein
MSMHASERVSETGTGRTFFASMLMMIGGAMAACVGLAGIVKEAFYVITPNYWITINVTAWGWTFLVLGIVGIAAGLGVMTGANWARWTGIVVTSVAAVVAFLFLPIAPFLSMTLIAIDLWVIYTLVVTQKEQMIYLNTETTTATQRQPQSQPQSR